MHKFTREIPTSHRRLTSVGCEEIKKRFKRDDSRSKQITLFNPMWFQFWAHQCLDSTEIDGEKFNRYDGFDNGQGLYPVRMDSPLLKGGYFKLSKNGLPAMSPVDESKPIELTVDAHRGNENKVLKALHRMGSKIHNKRMDAHGDFDLAKSETIATLNIVTLNESLVLCQMDWNEFFEIQVNGLNLSLEWNFAIARWAHAQMPDTVNDEHIFEKGWSGTVDVESLYTSERARDLNLGVSPAMTDMAHLPSKPHSILERTFARHLELGLPCWQDLADAYDVSPREDVPEGCPIWPGLLMEAEDNDGMLGRLGRRVVADGLAGSLLWSEGEGVWHPRWKGAPTSTLEIIKYAEL